MASDIAAGLPPRGETWFHNATAPTSYSFDTVKLEGRTAEFLDKDPTETYLGCRQLRSAQHKTAILVRNTSGITLLAKRLVKWATGFRGKRVDGYCTTTAAEAAGVVDEYLSTGIPTNDLGWIDVAGPTLCLTDLAGAETNVIAEGDVMFALTAATSQATTAGRVRAWIGLTATSTQTTDGTLGLFVVNNIGRAMSAKTTSNTNASVLIDLQIMKKASQ